MAEPSAARLYVLAGPDLARSFPLGERTTLGRSDECDVILRDRSISRKHAVLVRSEQSWFVQDLGSTNGVSKGGKRVERIELADGDEFLLGELPLRFRLVAAEEAAGVELDFDLEPGERVRTKGAPAAAPARAPAPSAPLAARAPAAAAEDEIEIEEEIEIEGPDAEPSAHAELAATTFAAPRAARHTGLFAGDLEQRPLWVRGLLLLVLLALCAGLAYGAFWAVTTLRSGL